MAARVLALLLAGSAVMVAALTEVYPFPSYLRPLIAADPYISSYCVLTGSAGTVQGTSSSQRYLNVQPCDMSQIRLYQRAVGEAPGLELATLSTGARAVDLGTSADLAAAYGNDATYYSVRYNVASQQIQVGLAASPITLPPSAVGALNLTESGHSFAVTPGHIYVARFSETPGASATWADTVAAIKLIIVDWPASDTDVRVPTVRWEVLAGASNTPPATTLQTVNATAQSAHVLGAWGVALSVICLLAILGGVAYVLYARRRAGGAGGAGGNIPGVTTTTYQTLDK